MALYVEHTGDKRVREPLGGQEADGFDQWLEAAELQAREARDALIESLPLENHMRYVAREAATHYGSVLHAWRHVTRDQGGQARHEFEVRLISEVMRAYGAADFARRNGMGPNDVSAGGRPMADISAEYLRACIILARYVGVDDATVAACQDNQDALTALRNTRA